MIIDAMKRALNVDVFKDGNGQWLPAYNGTEWNDWDAAVMPWVVNSGTGLDLSPDNIYATQPAVRTVVRFRALNAAGVPIHAFTKQPTGEKARVNVSPLEQLMAQPAPTVTGYDWVRNLMLDRDMWDRHCSILRFDNMHGWRLDRIPPRRWRFKRDGADRPTVIQHLPKGTSDPSAAETLSLEQCFWMDDYPSSAKTPMDGIRDLLIEEHESAAARIDTWRERARIPGIITRPANTPWPPDARDSFKKSWSAFRAGGARTGKTPVLEDGMQYQSVTMLTSVDAQQIEAKILNLRIAAAYFQTPSVLVGDNEGANYSNVGAYRELVYADALGNDFAAIDAALNARVTPRVADDPAEFLEFHVKAKLRMSFKEQADIYQKALGVPYMSVNEVRASENLGASPNPDHDTPIIPINIQPPDNPGAETNIP